MTSSEKEKILLKIIDQHNSQIYRVCWGFTDNSEDVKDLYQEVVLNIWKGLAGFRNNASYSTWIHRISINTCIFWKKKSKPNINLAEQSMQENTIEFELTNEKPQLNELRKNIQSLKKVDKSLILLLLEGLSYKEISEITGLSTNHVGVRINRIKSRLKKMSLKNG